MNVLNIALKELIGSFRDRRTLFFMLAFPLVLMLVLGTALSNAFNTVQDAAPSIRVLVQDNSTGQQHTAFAAFRQGMEGSGFKFTDAAQGINGPAEVEANRYDDYAVVSDSGIQLYGSDRNAIESNLTQGMLSAFADRYNAAAAIAASEPSKAAAAFSSSAPADGYVQETSVTLDRMPGAMDYYGVVLTVMIALWSALSAANLVKSEIRQGTALRLIAAPVRKSEIFAGKVLGSLAVNMICVLIIIVFSREVFHAYWGNHMLLVIAVLLSVVVLSVSLGLGISYLMGQRASGGLIMLLVQLASFFGGAYFPLGNMDTGSLLKYASNLSPIHGANQALTELIYDNSSSAALQTIGINAGIAVLLLAGCGLMMSKREGLL